MRKKVLILFSIICFFCVVLFCIFNFVVFRVKFENHVVFYSKKYSLEPALVYAVVKAESDFDEKAVSKSDARGLMQILPTTANWIASVLEKDDFDASDLFDPETNIEFGCFYLNYLKQKFADERAVICAYNAGETIVRTWLDENGVLDENKIAYGETKKYLKRVVGFKRVYKTYEICV